MQQQEIHRQQLEQHQQQQALAPQPAAEPVTWLAAYASAPLIVNDIPPQGPGEGAILDQPSDHPDSFPSPDGGYGMSRAGPSKAEMVAMIRLAMGGIDQAQGEASMLHQALEAAQRREAQLESALTASEHHLEAERLAKEELVMVVSELSGPSREREAMRNQMIMDAGGELGAYIESLETALAGCERELQDRAESKDDRSKVEAEEEMERQRGSQYEMRQALEESVAVKEEELTVCTAEILALRDSLAESKLDTCRERNLARAAREALDRGVTNSQEAS